MTGATFSDAIVFIFALSAISLLQRNASKLNLLDIPDFRKSHSSPTPVVGGIGIFTAFLGGYSLFAPDWIFLPFVIGAGLLVVIGALDDRHNLGVKRRFLMQVAVVAAVVTITDVKIVSLGNLLGTGDLMLGSLAVPFTVFAIVGAMNAFNMIDGMDGLAGSLAVVSLAALAVAAQAAGQGDVVFVLETLVVGCVGFLLFNLRGKDRPARVFMGDAGSMFLGFAVSYFAVYLTQQESPAMAPVTALWVVAIPLLDAFRVMYKRLCTTGALARADRSHVHHVLQDSGFSVTDTLVVLVFTASVFAALGFVATHRPELEPFAFGGFGLLVVVFGWTLERIAAGRFPLPVEQDAD